MRWVRFPDPACEAGGCQFLGYDPDYVAWLEQKNGIGGTGG